MREIDAEITELLNPGDLECDVACLVYDASNPESFKFCATTYDVSIATPTADGRLHLNIYRVQFSSLVFNFVQLLCFQKHFKGSNIPLLMVACKAEQTHVKQSYGVTPEEFCKANGLAPPQFYSAVDTNPTNLYTSLAIMAAHP